MELLFLMIINFIWILFSMSEGLNESIFDMNKAALERSRNFDSAKIYNTKRFLFASLLALLSSFIFNYYSLIIFISLILMFSFFYKTAYCCTVNYSNKKINLFKSYKYNKVLRLMESKKNELLIVSILIELFLILFLL